MKRHLMRLSSWALLLSFIPTLAQAQQPSRFVIFGDSLSDAGNYFADTGMVSLPPFLPIPDAPYAIGGHHFSNGATWIEQMATWMNASPSAKPALVNPGHFTNYAFGRARARPNALSFSPFDLGTQVDLFLDDFDDAAPADATYVIWIGTNDARDAFVLGGDATIVTESLVAIATNLSILLQMGARDFVVLNVPDLGLVPAINSLPDPIPAQATGFTQIYNILLSATLDALEPAILGAGGSLTRVDTFAILQSFVADPAAFGLSNVTDAFLEFETRGRFMQPGQTGYLFWDDVHPTRDGHTALGSSIMDALNAP